VVPGLDARDAAPADPRPLVRDLRPDALHLHNVVNPSALEWAAAEGAVITVHDHRAFCPGRGKLTASGRICRTPFSGTTCAACFEEPAYFEHILGTTRARLDAIRGMRAVITTSRYTADELSRCGVPPPGIHVLPPFIHGLDPDAPPEGPETVLFAGRLAAAKGVWEAAAAWRRSRVDLPLVFAGTGPERGRLEAAGHRVLGWVDHGRLSGLYRSAAVLVMPSRWQEPYGIAGVEALALGTPVAAWESGGVAEWHPGGDLLVPWGDLDALAAAISAARDQRAAPAVTPSPEARTAALLEIYAALLT